MSRLYRGALAALVLSTATTAARAQSTPATPFLPRGHWSVEVARKLDAADRDVRFDGGARTPSLSDVVAVLQRAAARPADDPLGRLARGALARLREEFHESLGTPVQIGSNVAVGGAVAAGGTKSTPGVAPGGGLPGPSFVAPRQLGDDDGFLGGATLGARVGRHLTTRATVEERGGTLRAREAQAVLAAGPIGLWAGRRAPAYGPSWSGGVTIGGDAAFDGAGIFLLRARALPGFLRYIGPWHAEIFGTRLDSNFTQRHPWFAGGRLSIAPLRVLQLGWNRGAMFGGDKNYPITFGRLFDVAFIGFRHGQGTFEDQVMSFDARLTPRVGGVPVVGHLEWGTEDAAGAIRNVPGIVGGVELPVVPGAPWLALGVERSSFAHSCCKNPPWARHNLFRDGWTHDGALIGNPLGGEGRELAGRARLTLLDARFQPELTAFVRDRGEENLFAPTRQGRSRGAAGRLMWRLTPHVELQATGHVERGDVFTLGTGTVRPAWRADSASASVIVRF